MRRTRGEIVNRADIERLDGLWAQATQLPLEAMSSFDGEHSVTTDIPAADPRWERVASVASRDDALVFAALHNAWPALRDLALAGLAAREWHTWSDRLLRGERT